MVDDPTDLPAYRDLPVVAGMPPGSSWGLWGEDDQLGTLNLLTDERTVRALAHVRSGRVFNLGLPLDEPRRNAESRRANPVHQILYVGFEHRDFEPGGADDWSQGSVGRDDYLERVWLQGSTQWDGLAHFRHLEHGNYNGVADADLHGGPGTRLGIDQWAARGVVGRGVLADVAGYRAAVGRPLDPTGNEPITVADLEATFEHQGVEVEPGDVLLLRTGWVGHLMAQSDAERERLITPAHQRNPGVESSEEMVAYLWDLHIAALAADNITVEAYPAPTPEVAFLLHAHVLPLLGLPLGELWVLDDLADACREDGDYACLLVSVPLNVRGGMGSPAQAVALK
jgi:kynurenine formamidase